MKDHPSLAKDMFGPQIRSTDSAGWPCTSELQWLLCRTIKPGYLRVYLILAQAAPGQCQRPPRGRSAMFQSSIGRQSVAKI